MICAPAPKNLRMRGRACHDLSACVPDCLAKVLAGEETMKGRIREGRKDRLVDAAEELRIDLAMSKSFFPISSFGIQLLMNYLRVYVP